MSLPECPKIFFFNINFMYWCWLFWLIFPQACSKSFQCVILIPSSFWLSTSGRFSWLVVFSVCVWFAFCFCCSIALVLFCGTIHRTTHFLFRTYVFYTYVGSLYFVMFSRETSVFPDLYIHLSSQLFIWISNTRHLKVNMSKTEVTFPVKSSSRGLFCLTCWYLSFFFLPHSWSSAVLHLIWTFGCALCVACFFHHLSVWLTSFSLLMPQSLVRPILTTLFIIGTPLPS